MCLSQILKCISRRHSHPDIGRLVSLRRLCIVRRKSKDWGPSCFWSVSLWQYFPCQLYIKADGTVLYSSSTKCLDLGPKSLPHPSFRTLQSRAQVLSSPSTQIAPILRVSACGKSSWLALRWDDCAKYPFEFEPNVSRSGGNACLSPHNPKHRNHSTNP